MPNKHLDHLEDLILYGRREATNAVNELMNHPYCLSSGMVHLLLSLGLILVMVSSLLALNQFSTRKKSKFAILILILTNITKATLRTFFVYVFIIALASVVLSSFDFIGVGGGMVYRPNVVEYRFPTQKTHGHIVLAAHTGYTEIHPDAVGVGNINIYGEDSGASL